MRNTSVRHFLTAFCLLIALTLAVAPAALPVDTIAPDQTTIAAFEARGPRGGIYSRIIRNLRRLFGMSTDDDELGVPPPMPTTTP